MIDLNDLWQEQRVFILGLAGSAVVFFGARSCLVGSQKSAAGKARARLVRVVRQITNPRTVKPVPPGEEEAPKGLFSAATRRILEREARLEEESYRALYRSSAFARRESWPVKEGIGFTVPVGTPQPSFLCDECAAALDAFWRRNLATRWVGKNFAAQRQRFAMTTRPGGGGGLSPPESFLVALDLADRVFHLVAHHRLSRVEVAKIHSLGRSAAARRGAVEDDLLQGEVALDLVLSGPSLAMRLFLQDLLVNEGETLARNAQGEDRVAIDGGGGFFRRTGSPWPLQVEALKIVPEVAEDPLRGSRIEARLTLVARLLRPLAGGEQEE